MDNLAPQLPRCSSHFSGVHRQTFTWQNRYSPSNTGQSVNSPTLNFCCCYQNMKKKITTNDKRDTKCHRREGGEEGAGAYSFVASLSHLATDHASFPRWSTASTPNRDISDVWAFMMIFQYIPQEPVYICYRLSFAACDLYLFPS